MFESIRNWWSGNNKPEKPDPLNKNSSNRINSEDMIFEGTPRNLSSPGFTFGLVSSLFDGEKYPGGLSNKLDFFYVDYWTLRSSSYRLYTENRYAQGLIKRLLTNEIHRGLTLEATISANILGLSKDFVNTWSDDVEEKFEIWSSNKELVSQNGQFNFGQTQIEVRKTALLSGDCLIILRQHPVLKIPVIEIIDGSHIRTPIKKVGDNEVRHGVELDKKGRHVAFYVPDTSDLTGLKSVRIPARGTKSGRKIAWMVYGNRIRIDDVRGMPMLGVIMQALKELDRYSDAEQRAAVINAILPLFIKKGQNKPGTMPLAGGAVRKNAVVADDTASTGARSFNIDQQLPGLVLDELQQGEEPVSFSTVRPNVNYRVFEEAMMASFAWVNEIPPNIFRLAFSANYSASTGEVNELKLYLDKIRWVFAADCNKPVYGEWLISMVLMGLISAPGLLENWRNPRKFLETGAWFASEWFGAIKPSMRLNQDVKAFRDAIAEGFVTRDIASKTLFGRKYTTMVRRLERENDQLAETLQPLMDAGLIKKENVNSETN